MKQLFQSLSTGSIEIAEVPVPNVERGNLLISTTRTLVSAGTEKMLMDFGKANLIDKARQQPEKVKEAIQKAQNEGPLYVYEAIQNKLNEPLPLGYCNVGVVVEVGKEVIGFKPGDRVVSNGPHSEIVNVPQNLCCLIPAEVSDEEAAFTVLSSIGLQGIRLAQPSFGETFLVSGLGLIGLLTGQLLIAQGCRVLGIDPDQSRCDLAESLGISSLRISSSTDQVAWCNQQTLGIGIDGAIITASTTSNSPIDVASQASRQRGRIVLVGVTGLELRRDLFYKKELSFQVSCSYGPGRYDDSYEKDGNDYPIGLVRWTEQRNFQAVLQALSKKSLKIDDLISHKFPFESAGDAYNVLCGNIKSLGIVLEYKSDFNIQRKTIELNDLNPIDISIEKPAPISFIGAGNYASRVLIPAFKNSGAYLHTIGSQTGNKTVNIGRKFGFLNATTDLNSLIDNDMCKAVVITTRHDSHGDLVAKALEAGKHVFVEKPLCLNIEELHHIQNLLTEKQILMVGYNRRFAPLIIELKRQIKNIQGTKSFVYLCNAGYIPSEHWTQNPKIGGGRLIGEACHFIDLICYLAEESIVDLKVVSCQDSKPCPDTFSVQICFNNGSIGTVHYFANGHKLFPKERLEIFAGQKTFQLDNFKKLKGWGVKGFKNRSNFKQDKGQKDCVLKFLNSIEHGGSDPIPRSQIFEVQRWLIEAVNS